MKNEHEKVMIGIGENIQKFRRQKKMRQLDLSIDSEIELSRLAEFDRGKGNPTLRTLVKIAKALDVKLIDLIPDI